MKLLYWGNPIIYYIYPLWLLNLSSLTATQKSKEVKSFLANEAVRKCMDNVEVKKAYESNCIDRARWVLTWKLTPPEDRSNALQDAKTNPNTRFTKDSTLRIIVFWGLY